MDKKKTLEHFKKHLKKQDQLFSSLSQIDASNFLKKEDANSWNVLQVLAHLHASEKSSLNYLIFKSKDPKASYQKTGLKEKFNTWILKRRMASPKKIKAPEVAGLSPSAEGLDYETIITEWKETREKLKTFLEELDDEKFSLNLYKHPAIGRINLFQMVEFFACHIDRHEIQIQRILKK